MKEITYSDFDDKIFKYVESNWLEFKIHIKSSPIIKITETICGMLNSEGGYIIIGINDNGETVGINAKSKDIDKFKLSLDNVIRNNEIIYQNDEIIKEQFFTITDIINKNKKKFLLIKLISQNDKKYKLLNGNIIHRLNASNNKIKTTKLMTETDYLSKLETNQKELITNYEKIIKDYKIKNKNMEIGRKKIINEYMYLYYNFEKYYDIFNPLPKQFIMK
jgi:predicted HTH transcriptional regulator